ncbi:hypothetical protein HY477_04050 [Candidatus Uhrbacteria bacterium]|nr:hypothetical protein [Candidatus Uhrbacteria bacterium]
MSQGAEQLKQGILQKTQTFFGQSGYVPDSAEGVPLALRIGVIFNTALLLVGIIFLMVTVYSGIKWMTAGGNEETMTKARDRIKIATIGLAIILGAWIITTFVLRSAFGPIEPPGTGAVEVRVFR